VVKGRETLRFTAFSPLAQKLLIGFRQHRELSPGSTNNKTNKEKTNEHTTCIDNARGHPDCDGLYRRDRLPIGNDARGQQRVGLNSAGGRDCHHFAHSRDCQSQERFVDRLSKLG
jgi:hypothetical protein